MSRDLQLHIPTLMLALLSGYALLAAQLWIAQRGRLRHAEMRLWTWGCWALLLGFAMLAARVVLPMWLSALLGNGLIVLGILIYDQAIFRHVLGRGQPWWLWGALPAGWGLIAWMLDWPLAPRTAIVSFLYALLLVPGLWVLFRQGWRAENSLRCVALSLLLAAGGLVFRGVHAWTQPGDYGELLQSSLGQGLTFLFSFICLLGAGFGFVLASFERTASRMEDMATTDGLTGCINRSTTDALLAHSLERGRRDGAPVAFALLDLDLFKQVNDNHGHRAGDAALKAITAEIRQRLRGSDVLGRMGGEEFGLVLPATDAPGAMRLLEQVRAAVEGLRLSDEQGRPFALTISGGVAVAASDSHISGDELYMLADRALYEAKHAGRNCIRLYG